MGSWFSSPSPFVKYPSVYATELGEEAVPSNIRTYDYVIVGGGVAACVLARRLTDDPKISVLMIEAGKSHMGHLFSRMPATFPKLFKSDLDWNYTTTNQVNVDNRSMYWPAGKVIGGGSMINALIYQRPCADDIKEWAKLGAIGWDWENDFKTYLVKSEKYTPHPQRPNADASHRGDSGLWSTTHPDRHPLSARFVDACEQIGIPRIDDTTRPEGPLGATYISSWIDPKGERSSAAHAYLTPDVLQRPNLTVALETTVTRILFSTTSGIPRAIGVELAQGPDRPVYQVNARREVLCCAGAIKTPQILMLSGIGPKGELERLDIPVVKELQAVGRNLCDHLMVTAPFRAKPGTVDPLATPIGGIMPMLRWLLTGGGPFAMLTGQSYAFVKSTDTSLPFDRDVNEPVKCVDTSAGRASPDIEYIVAPMMFLSHGFISAPPRTNFCTIATVLLRPQSTGTITLKSANIWDGPDINPNYLSVDSDMDTFVRAFRLSLRIGRSRPLVDHLLLKDDIAESDSIYFPGDANPDKVTDEALRRYIKRTTETLYHPMCTARIGHSSADSVVNHEFRVHGVSGLRVIDASVLPSPFPGHTCATVIAFAEKASDFLKGTVY
ncbi:GMC oxidoreductase [Gautieria morchelliformis]|nr:GMC oxidoreductase [Gautieria morchelliformis]